MVVFPLCGPKSYHRPPHCQRKVAVASLVQLPPADCFAGRRCPPAYGSAGSAGVPPACGLLGWTHERCRASATNPQSPFFSPAGGLVRLLARDETRRGSDVDLGVVLDPDDRETRLDVEVTVGRALQRDVDLVDLRRAPPLLRFEVSRDGILLVEREPGSWIRFRARAMLDWWDWAPVARIFHDTAVARLRS
ncbi:MAG: nucleotidyltransferase domain-containing protein, partial [Thermoanaerobaculia bacterium]